SPEREQTYMSLSISPTLVWTSKFFVGFILRQSSGTFPGALDQTPPTFLNRSFVTANTAGEGNIFDLTVNSFVSSHHDRGSRHLRKLAHRAHKEWVRVVNRHFSLA